ncbi:UV damage endonuclease UvsE [Methanocella sp. MCL-LM]|uniref:UV damage endonuclease UvsE n=1 Tax=Methanocella sp. MCL-LM TaxID=3412035 RepID=UPI003C70CA5E
MRIGFAAIPFDKRLLPVTSKKSAAETVERLKAVARFVSRLGIDFYRIPANISPRESLESIEEARDEIRALGDLFRKLNIRTCFHVTYYCILNSPNREVLEKSIDELRCLQLFDRYSGGGNHIELHAGGAYGEREAAIQRFITVVTSLEEDIFKLLRLENEEHPGKIGTVAELRQINRETDIPLLFDIAHYRVNPLEEKLRAREITDSFLYTWRAASTFPVLHYSTTLPTKGTHLPVDPSDFWSFVKSLEGLAFDIMLETKEKEKDVLKVKAWIKEHAAVVQ